MARWDEQPSLRSRPERTQFGHDHAAFEPPHHEQVDYYKYVTGLKRKLSAGVIGVADGLGDNCGPPGHVAAPATARPARHAASGPFARPCEVYQTSRGT